MRDAAPHVHLGRDASEEEAVGVEEAVFGEVVEFAARHVCAKRSAYASDEAKSRRTVGRQAFEVFVGSGRERESVEDEL